MFATKRVDEAGREGTNEIDSVDGSLQVCEMG
jgi:hypothetical protein